MTPNLERTRINLGTQRTALPTDKSEPAESKSDEQPEEVLQKFWAWRRNKLKEREGVSGPETERFGANRKNVVITGLGRSGTTLACHLLNKLPNTIALSEPIPPGKFADKLPDHEAVCDAVELYYRRMRRMARKEGVVISKHVGGIVPDNTKGMVDGVRRRIAEKGKIPVGKELQPGFMLAIKDVGMFTALLPTLAKRFPCYAIVRNPLSVIASTNSVNSGARNTTQRKNPPAMERYNPGLLAQAKDANDKEDKRFSRFHRLFEHYQRELPEGHIIRYEDLVASGGRALDVITPAARELDEPLESKNLNPLYDRDRMLRLGEQMLKSDGAYWNFYSREEVEEMLGRLT